MSRLPERAVWGAAAGGRGAPKTRGAPAQSAVGHHITCSTSSTTSTGEVPEQIHLGPAVADLDAAVSEAQEPGAELVPLQPVPDRFRVLLDPPGHPFCHSTQIPEAAR